MFLLIRLILRLKAKISLRLSAVASKHLVWSLLISSVPADQYLKRCAGARPLVAAYLGRPPPWLWALAERLMKFSARAQSLGITFFLDELLEGTPAAQRVW